MLHEVPVEVEKRKPDGDPEVLVPVPMIRQLLRVGQVTWLSALTAPPVLGTTW